MISTILVSFDTLFVGVAGFEPATSASQTRRDNRATLHPETGYLIIFEEYCGENGTRTHATLTRRQISNLLRYHSGTSPIFLLRTFALLSGCKCKFYLTSTQLFFYVFLNIKLLRCYSGYSTRK